MPSPKDIKNILKATQGTKAAGKAATMEELLGRLPKPTKAQQLEVDLMFQRLKEERDALYPKPAPATETGKAALAQAKKTLTKKKPDAQKQALEDELARLQAGKERFLEPSKVKQRVYHGTTKDFSAFDKARLGESGAGGDRLGFWFSQEPEGTDLYTWGKENALTMPAYLRLQNPYLMPAEEFYELSKMPPLAGEKLRKDLIKQGHDGVIAETGEGDAYAVFEPTQIKSAIGNVGTYDITNPDITKADGGRVDDEGNVAADIESMLQRVGAFKDPVTGVSGLTTSAGFSPLEGVDVRGIASLIRGAEPKDIKDLALTIELAKRMGVKLNDKGLSQIYGKLSGDGGLRLGYSPKDKSAHLSYWAPFAEGGEVQHLQVGGIPKLFKTASNVGKAEKSMEAARNLMQANRPLSLAERQFVAEVAARQAEELASLRPKEIASVEAKKSRGPSPKPARAKPKTKAEISAIAERVAPQMLGEFVRQPGKTESVTGKSRKQFDLEQELQHDMQRSRDVPEAKVIDLEPHVGSVMLSLPGDTSISDYDIFSIGGNRLREPARQYGGPRFGLGHPEEAGWASGLDQAAGFQRRVNAASQQYGDVPVLANYLAMGPEGLNYATHFTDTLLKGIDPTKMSKKDIEAFNRMMRYGRQGVHMPDFPGIENPEAAYLYLANNPVGRKLVFNPTMQLTGTTEGFGLPSGLNVRHAITEPELRDIEPGMTGFSLLQMEPGVTGLKPSAHPTYSHDIPGKFLGRTDVLMPYELTFPDTVAGIRANPKQAGSEFGTLQMLGGKQIIDQQLLDEIGEYRRRIKQLTGKKDGGVVHMAGGNEPGESIGEMFKPKPLKIPSTLTDLLTAIKSQFGEQVKSMDKPRSVTDVALRGPLAFTAGAPMDILGMMGSAVDHVQKTHPLFRKPASVMDTGPEKAPPMGYAPKFPVRPQGDMPFGSEHIKELMNKSGLTTGEERPLLELGAAMFGPGAVSKALKYGKAGATALAPTAQDMLQMHLERLSDPTRSYVIKPEGGNWIQGSVEKYLNPFRWTPEASRDFNELGKQQAIAINNFVDKKLAKYMRNEMATPSDPVRIQADEWANKKTQLLADKQKQIDKARADMEKAQRERNVNPEMLTRSQARIRELEKERALIENRTGLHYEPQNASFQAELRRKNAKQPASVKAKTESGKKWEDVTDASILSGEYRFQTPLLDNELYTKGSSADRLKAQEDALREIGGEFAVQNPDAIVNKMDMGFGNVGLGWGHLIDELEGALDIEASGLPKSLELTPKTLDKMSVPQAIEHVDKINAWRASQKAEADAARAANQATVVHKEYPEAGLKWVELKIPEMLENFKAPDRYEIKLPVPHSETYAIWDKEKQGYITSGLKSEKDALKHLHEIINKSALEDALKYEGEMLSHCVGGYCPDVIEGRSRIFSLRDEAGRPHATIEVEPEARIGFRQGEGPKNPDEDYALRNQYVAGVNDGSISKDMTFAEWWRSQNNIPEPVRPERISQIKGLSNKKPQAEFIPYIQDFVKSKDWSNVGDIHHTDLFRVTPGQKLPGFSKEITPGYYTLDDFKRMAAENEMPQEILDNWMDKLGGRRFFGMAEGGAIDYEARFNQMLQDHVAGMAEGGAVDYESRFNDMLQKHVQGLAEGGEVENAYNSDPDMSDGGRFVQAPAFANGGAVKSIWTVN